MNNFFDNPFVQYILSPMAVFGVLFFLVAKIYNLGGFFTKVSQAVETVSHLDTQVKELNNHMMIVKTHLVTTQGLDAGLFAPGSPLKLLSPGIALLKEIHFPTIYKKNKQWFIEQIKMYDHETISQIDEASLAVIEQCAENNTFADYKELAFQNGVTLDVLLKVISLYLRDELVKELIKKK